MRLDAVHGRRRALLLLGALAVLGIACAQARPPSPGVGAGVGDGGVLAFLAEGDTTVVDEYVRTPRELHGTLRIFSREPGGTTAAASYGILYASDGRPLRATLAVRQVSPGGVAATDARRWDATFDDDGSVVEVETGAGRRQETAAGVDALPLFGPSVAMLESVLLHARVRSLTRVPIFHLAAGGRVDTARIEWHSPDSADVVIAGARSSYRLDRSGRILGGTAAGERLRTVRLR